MSSSNNAASLMSSLMGDPDENQNSGGGGGGDDDNDLFGDIPIDDHNNNNNDSGAADANAESIYHDPMSSSGMQQQQSSYLQEQQPPPQQMQQPPPAQNNTNYPQYYPQPQQQQVMAPNITYAAPDSNASQKSAPVTTTDMSQSHPVLPTSSASASGTTPQASTANMSKSLLLNSGLLGDNNDEKKADTNTNGGGGGGDGDGLFDDIDQEEENKAKAAAAAAEAEKKKLEEQQAAAAAAAAEQQRQQQEEQQRQQQQIHQQQQQMQQPPPPNNMQNQQAYSLEARMQGMHLNNSQQQQQQNSFMQPPPNQSQMMNSQQLPPGQQQQQQQPMMMSQQQGQQQGQAQINNNTESQVVNQQGQQQQQQQQQQPPSQISVPGVAYREHSPGMDTNTNANANTTGNANSNNINGSYQERASAMMASSQMQPVQQQQQQPGYYPQNSPSGMQQQPPPQNMITPPHQQPQMGPGMMPQQQPHHQMMQQSRVQPAQHVPITKPPDVPTYYGKVTVNDPMLLQAPSKFLGMVGTPPYWSYQITTQILGQPPSVWLVRRRFNNVVALEDRLRQECPGAILPPRPDKHVSRAIEEASTHQSAEFAWQRAAELEKYLNNLVVHPEVFACQSLKMFLGLQDDMGTAWPECSANTFTRVSTMGASAAAKVAETGTSGFFGTAAPANTTPSPTGGGFSSVMGQVASSVGVGDLTEHVTEDSAELLALSSSESVRMGAVLQAVPKLEGAVTLLREQGEGAGAVGMELNRMAKEVLSQGDRELATPLEILSNGLLRHGRRTKRLGQELGQATITAFQMQYKLCRYEKMAWADRRNALAKRQKERSKADKRAQQLYHHQQQQYPPQYGGGGGYGGGYGQPQFNGQNNMGQLMSNATMSDNMAVNAVQECDAVGERLKREVNRISFSRRMDWAKSIKVIASYMKEAASERTAIWESTRDSFLQAFPEYHDDNGQWTNAEPNFNFSSQMMGSPQQQMQQQQQMNMGMNQSYMSPGMGQGPQQQMYGSMMGSAMAGTAAAAGGGYQQQ